MATHHIAHQRLILEASGVSPPLATEWYARLERLQETTLLPALVRSLDRMDNPATTTYIEWLEVSVDLDATAGEVAEQLRAALRPHFTHDVEQEAAAPLVEDVIYYLRAGNLPSPYPTLASFRERLSAWEPSAAEWETMLQLAATDLPSFIGRGTQVQRNFLDRAWWWLITHYLGGEGGRAGTLTSPQSVEKWQLTLLRAGFKVIKSPKRIQTRRTDFRRAGNGRTEIRPTASKSPNPPDPYYPQNAGLVLLHAYLPHLLKQLDPPSNLGAEGQRSRAAVLLHYLTHGTTEVAEWQLPLTKLLLGLHPDDYLPPAPELSDADRQVADELLTDVIDHWEALRNTHIDTLREGFLQRPGRLVPTPGGWQLTVEQRAHDVLLDRLPWAIGIVKTPWMKALLQVNWR